MSRIYKTEGVVLKRKNFGETDRLLTVFTKGNGKLVIVARGIRKIVSRKAPDLEPFTHLHFVLAIGRIFDYVLEVEVIEKYHFISNNLERIAHAYRLVELVDRLCPEREPYVEVFALLIETLRNLNSEKQTQLMALSENIALKLLWELGYLPREKLMSGITLTRFLETVMEKTLKSQVLLKKLGETERV